MFLDCLKEQKLPKIHFQMSVGSPLEATARMTAPRMERAYDRKLACMLIMFLVFHRIFFKDWCKKKCVGILIELDECKGL